MDKGFNDDELADIMNEIESLEQEFTDEVEAKKEPVQAQNEPSVQNMDNVEDHQNDVEESDQNVETVVAKQHQEEDSESEIDEAFQNSPEPSVAVLKDVAKKPVEEVTSIHHAHDDQSSFHTSNSSAQTSMSFKVEGDMKLDLAFNISGSEVQLSVNEHGLEIGLEGGAKFSVPLSKTHHHKKAA